MKIYLLLAFLTVLLSVAAQIILKVGSDKKEIKKYLGIRVNGCILSGYIIFIMVTIINLFVYSVLPLNYSMIFLPMNFVLTIIAAIIFFKEKVDKIEGIGIMIVVVGIILYAIF